MMHVDINCDLGEAAGNDNAILPWITSANIACGFHAGEPRVMRELVHACVQHGVAIGAHPGIRDTEGFGRREVSITPEEAYDIVVYQTGALMAFALAAGASLVHVKPHGALYNMAARDAALADAVVSAVRAVDVSLVLFGLAGSELVAAGKRAGIATASEAFADRTYMADGSLVSRQRAGAFVHDPIAAAERAIRMVKARRVLSIDGVDVVIAPDTICIHGDGPDAVDMAKALRTGLERAGIEVTAAAVQSRRG